MIPTSPSGSKSWRRHSRAGPLPPTGPSLYSALHSTSREDVMGASARNAVAVRSGSASDRNESGLPEHLQVALQQMETNLNTLSSLYRRVTAFTQTEAFMAAAKGAALFRSQSEILDDIKRSCEAELSFLASKLQDSAADKGNAMFASPVEKSALIGWQSIYCLLSAVARSSCARTGALFVIPQPATSSFEADVNVAMASASPTSSSTSAGRTSAAAFKSGLRLACMVSAAKLTPLANGTLHADIVDIVSTVVQTRCSLNAKSSQGTRRAAKMGFETILCVPLLIPGSDSSIWGAVVLLDRIPPPKGAVKLFNDEDEMRLRSAAESISELIRCFRLIQGEPKFLTPTSFENTWNIATREDSVLQNTFHEGQPKGFVFRDTGTTPTSTAQQLELQLNKQRAPIGARNTPLIDLQEALNTLTSENSTLRAALLSKEADIASLKEKVLQQQSDYERAYKQVETMRLANELLLRNSFVTPIPSDVLARLAEAAGGESLEKDEAEMVSESTLPPTTEMDPCPEEGIRQDRDAAVLSEVISMAVPPHSPHSPVTFSVPFSNQQASLERMKRFLAPVKNVGPQSARRGRHL